MAGGRILITGATGFVGRRVAERLAGAGHTLTLAVRRPPPDAPASARIVGVGEIGPDTEWRDALQDVGTVLHLAAHVHVAPERAVSEESVFARVNHHGTVRLHEEACRAGVGLFVFLGSITVLGAASEPGRPFDDASVPEPRTPYARSKLAAETVLREANGPTLVVLRPPLIAGRGVGGNLRSLARLAALPLPLPFGALANRRTLLSLDNLCSALEAIITRPVPGTYGIGDRAPLSTAEIVAALRAGLGRRPLLVPVPVPLMRRVADLAGFGGHAQRLFGDLEMDSSRFRAAFDWHDEVETRQALAEIG